MRSAVTMSLAPANQTNMHTTLKLTSIAQSPLLSTLRHSEKQELCRYMSYLHVPRGEQIYQQGEVADHLFLLIQGTIKIARITPGRKEVIKSIIQPCTIFGARALLGESCRSDYAQSTHKEARLFAIKVAHFRRLMFRNFAFTNQLITLFGSQLMETENQLEALVTQDARSRIIAFIKSGMAQRGQRVGYEMLLQHSLTHQEIANITHTSRQTVTLVLNELKKNNLIYFNRGRILVRDLAKLA